MFKLQNFLSSITRPDTIYPDFDGKRLAAASDELSCRAFLIGIDLAGIYSDDELRALLKLAVDHSIPVNVFYSPIIVPTS